jgi:serine/threonine protein kinase
MVHSTSGTPPVRRKRTRDITDCMDIQEPVGTGTYGVVYKAVDKTLPEKPLVALKKIKMEKETQGFPVTAIREIKILNLMNHKNVVHLREIVTYENTGNEQDASYRDKGIGAGDVFMVFEYVDYDLSVILKSERFRATPEVIKSYMHQLLEGVDYLHKNHILHRDLKTANILITKNNVLKIADWGLARSMPQSGHGHKLTVPVVTLWYRSPELTCGNKAYGPEVDIWSVG